MMLNRTLRWNKPKVVDLLFFIMFVSLLFPRRLVFYPLAFGVPTLVLSIFAFMKKVDIRAGILFYYIVGIISLLNAFREDFALLSFLLALVSYTSLLWLFSKTYFCQMEQHIYYKWFIRYVWVELVIGIIQLILAFYESSFNWDVVRGTFGPGGQRILAVLTMAGAVFYLSKYFANGNKKYALGGLVMFLGNLLTFSFAVTAIGILSALFAYRRKFVRWYKGYIGIHVGIRDLIVAFFITAFIVVFFGTRTFFRLRHYVEMSQRFGLPRMVLTKGVFTSLPTEIETQPLIGVGLGQFSSWAAAVLNPDYQKAKILGRHTKSILVMAKNELATRYIYGKFYGERPWLLTDSIFGHPLYSWLSVYSELGVIGVVLVLNAFRKLRNGLKLKTFRLEMKDITYVQFGAFCLIFVTGLWFLDNFAEYPWVSGILISAIVVASSNVRPQSCK